jgi:hypothetical protein
VVVVVLWPTSRFVTEAVGLFRLWERTHGRILEAHSQSHTNTHSLRCIDTELVLDSTDTLV